MTNITATEIVSRLRSDTQLPHPAPVIGANIMTLGPRMRIFQNMIKISSSEGQMRAWHPMTLIVDLDHFHQQLQSEHQDTKT